LRGGSAKVCHFLGTEEATRLNLIASREATGTGALLQQGGNGEAAGPKVKGISFVSSQAKMHQSNAVLLWCPRASPRSNMCCPRASSHSNMCVRCSGSLGCHHRADLHVGAPVTDVTNTNFLLIMIRPTFEVFASTGGPNLDTNLTFFPVTQARWRLQSICSPRVDYGLPKGFIMDAHWASSEVRIFSMKMFSCPMVNCSTGCLPSLRRDMDICRPRDHKRMVSYPFSITHHERLIQTWVPQIR